VRIGVNPLLWINDDKPELGANIPLERCLAEASEAGYAGIELGHKFPRDERELRPLLTRHRLALISGWYSARLIERGADRELEELRAHFELLQVMECRTLIFGDVSGAIHRGDAPLSSRPVLDPKSWGRFVRELERLARKLSAQGIQLAYHHHMGTIVQTPVEIARLLNDTTSAVGLLLDTGHYAFAAHGGDALAPFVERYGDRIVHVHLKDVRREVGDRALARDDSFLDAVCDGVFTVPGDGSLNLTPVLTALKRRNYDGWIVVEAEQDPARAHPLTYAKIGYANVACLLARASR
jgi:inosose dehydratase